MKITRGFARFPLPRRQPRQDDAPAEPGPAEHVEVLEGDPAAAEPASNPVAEEPLPVADPEPRTVAAPESERARNRGRPGRKAQPAPVAVRRVESEGAPAAATAVLPAEISGRPREWNVWELDRLARDGAGVDAARDEERALLLMYLREFAGPDGLLPVSFDDLVRESFGELIAAGGGA